MFPFIRGILLPGAKLLDGLLASTEFRPSLIVNTAAQPSATNAMIIIMFAVKRFELFMSYSP